MKNSLHTYIILALGLLFLGVFPAHKKQSSVQWVTEKTYDFGIVENGTVTGTVFTFKNISAQPIILQTVRTTCGCTAAKWTETPIAPGATGDIHIEYSADRNGGFKKKIMVFFDVMRKAEILRIRGNVG